MSIQRNASLDQMPQCKLQNIILNITKKGKNPRDNNEPWGSLSSFKTQNKPIEDDDQPFDSSSSSTMQ